MRVTQNVPLNFVEGYIESVDLNIEFMKIAYEYYDEKGDETGKRRSAEKLSILTKKQKKLIDLDIKVKNEMIKKLNGGKDGRE